MYDSMMSDTEVSDACDEEEMLDNEEWERVECIEEMVRYLDHRFDYETVWDPMYDIYMMDLNRLYDVFTCCEVYPLRDREYDILTRWYDQRSTREERSVMEILCTLSDICHTPINPWTLANALQYCRI